MQEKMPMASGDVWQSLSKAKINLDEKKNVFVAVVPPEVKAMDGKVETVAGFMLPLESTFKHTHFLLSKRTPTCPYCMPGGPVEIIDVYMKTSADYSRDIIFITGKFKIVDDSKSGLYFRLEDATTQSESNPLKPKGIMSQPPV